MMFALKLPHIPLSAVITIRSAGASVAAFRAARAAGARSDPRAWPGSSSTRASAARTAAR